jgi:colicin import membrane protein
MSKTKFTASEWQMVRDAPFSIHAGIAAADSKQAILTSRKESKALDGAVETYKSRTALIIDVKTNEEKPAKEIGKATMFDVEQTLGRISQIVENKCGLDEMDAFNEFLLTVGEQIAEAAGEGILGIGDNVSKRETASLQSMTKALRATDADKRSRRQAKDQLERRQAAEAKAASEKAKREEEAKAKAEIEKRKAEVEARAQKRRAEKAKADAEAKKKVADRTAKAAELAKAQAAKLESRRKTEAAKVAAAETAKFIAEHTVISGDNLSFISKKYFGTQAHWKLIYEANREVIGDNPNLIRVGQVFNIPKLPNS